jgi:tripartite-type tricarboxylate transporter receptor subunit TctC
MKAVSWFTRTTAVLVVRAENPKYTNLREFVQAARQKPGQVPIGIGAPLYRFNLVNLESALNAQFSDIPYAGNAGALTNDILGGTIDATFLEVGGALPLLQGGKLKALAVVGPERSPALPDVPTVSEIYPSYTPTTAALFGTVMYGLGVMAGTPDAAAKQIEAAANKAARNKAIADYAAQRGQQLFLKTGDEVQPLIDQKVEAYREIAARTKLLERTRK